MDFIKNIEKLNLANLVGEVTDNIVDFQIFLTFRKLYNERNDNERKYLTF